MAALTTAIAKRPLVPGIQDFLGQHPDTAYVSGDTGVAYEPNLNEVYSDRLAAATYTANQPLTIGASGRLTAAAAGTAVVAFFVDVPGAFSADARADARALQMLNAMPVAVTNLWPARRPHGAAGPHFQRSLIRAGANPGGHLRPIGRGRHGPSLCRCGHGLGNL